eukprot:2035144-Rhodomonas_salina.11
MRRAACGTDLRYTMCGTDIGSAAIRMAPGRKKPPKRWKILLYKAKKKCKHAPGQQPPLLRSKYIEACRMVLSVQQVSVCLRALYAMSGTGTAYWLIPVVCGVLYWHSTRGCCLGLQHALSCTDVASLAALRNKPGKTGSTWTEIVVSCV